MGSFPFTHVADTVFEAFWSARWSLSGVGVRARARRVQRRAGCRHDCAGRASDDRGDRNSRPAVVDSDTRARARDRGGTDAQHRAHGRPDGGTAIDRTRPNDRTGAERDPDGYNNRDSGPDGDGDSGPDGDGDNGSDRRADIEPGRGSNGASDPLAHNETNDDADAAHTFADPVTYANGLTEADAYTFTETELAAPDREDRKPERQGGSIVRDRCLRDGSGRRQDRAQLRWRG